MFNNNEYVITNFVATTIIASVSQPPAEQSVVDCVKESNVITTSACLCTSESVIVDLTSRLD